MLAGEIVEAYLFYGEAARDAADRACMLVGGIAEPMAPRGRIRAAAALQVAVADVQYRAVLLELATGSSWGQVAAAMNMPAQPVRARLRRVGQPLIRAAARRSDA